MYEATERAVDRARAGEGPSLIEAVTMRMHGHAEHDPADYVPRELFEEWTSRRTRWSCSPPGSRSSASPPPRTSRRCATRPGVKAIEARKKSLGDPMPVPDREEERVYA